jgi:hypothetical protein
MTPDEEFRQGLHGGVGQGDRYAIVQLDSLLEGS